MGVFGNPTGPAWVALAAAGLTMEAIEKLRAAVDGLGEHAHLALTTVLAHLPKPEITAEDDPGNGPGGG